MHSMAVSSSRASLICVFVFVAACHGRAAPTSESTAPTSMRPSATSEGAPSPASAADGAGLSDAGLPDLSDAGRSAPVSLVRGAREILQDDGVVVARRPDAGSPLVLARAPAGARLSASLRPFLGRPDLLEVTLVASSESGWHVDVRETHYVVDTSGANDVLACVFDGDARSGGEYASTTTTVALKLTAAKPLAFDVERTTTSRASQPQPAPPPRTTTTTDHFEIGASECLERRP